jgi:hypothetical protein
VLVNRLEELADDKGYGLDTSDLLLRTNELPLEAGLLVFDVAFLYLEEFQVTGELLVLDVQVLLLQLLEEGSFLRDNGIKRRVLVAPSDGKKV